MQKTKIICTLGPSTDDREVLREMMLSGMNVARFNFSHGDYASHKARMDLICSLREELHLPIATMLDTKGPEIRLKKFKGGKIQLNKGDQFTLTTDDIEGTEKICSITYKNLPRDVSAGTKLLIDDGLIELRVDATDEKNIYCTVVNGGPVSNNKGINVPGARLSMPYISPVDREDILFGIQNGFDFIAASFVRSAQDILDIRHILEENHCNWINIIAKIENKEGVDNIDEIIRVSDGIMIARGDMGVELDLEEIPVIQKILIKKCYRSSKQVITATQMLESMIKNPRPTRAEANDVANAIYDGTSAIMLSGETAAGLYPAQAVKTMSRIAQRTERDIDYARRFRTMTFDDVSNVTTAISHATCTTALDLNAKAIITVTQKGKTARNISRFRPPMPIIACTPDERVCRQLNMSWGVTPIMIEEMFNTDELFEHAVSTAYQHGLVKHCDLTVMTAGVPLGVSGSTNLLKVHVVGDILVSGSGVTQQSVCAEVCVCQNEDDALRNFTDGSILAIPQTSNRILSVIKRASGIVTEMEGLNSHAAVVGLTLDIPVIVGATNATKILKSGTMVVLDAPRGIISSKNSQYK